MSNQPQENPERGPDGHWRQGHSGNPRGRPKGARHRVTILAEQLMQGDGNQARLEANAMSIVKSLEPDIPG